MQQGVKDNKKGCWTGSEREVVLLYHISFLRYFWLSTTFRDYRLLIIHWSQSYFPRCLLFVLLGLSLCSNHANFLTWHIPLATLLFFHFLPYFWLHNTPVQLVLDWVVMPVASPMVQKSESTIDCNHFI